MSVWTVNEEEFNKNFESLAGPSYILSNSNAFEQLFSTTDRRLSFAFGMLSLMIIND